MTTAAVVGIGDVSSVHLQAIEDLSFIDLVALVEPDPQRAAAAASHGVPVFASHHEMLAQVRPEVVHVTTPHHAHAEVTVDLLDAGIHVIQEKPIAASRADAEAICAAADRVAQSGTAKIAICLQNRYNATSRALKAAVDSGRLGPLTGCYASVVWQREIDYYRSRPWRATWAGSGGGLLINQALHTLDLVQWVLGGVDEVLGGVETAKFGPAAPPGQVDLAAGRLEVEDTAALYLRHPSGLHSSIYATLTNDFVRPVEVEIVGEYGSARIGRGGFDLELVAGPEAGTREHVDEDTHPSRGRSYWGYSHEALISDFYARLSDPDPFWISPRESMVCFDICKAAYANSGLGPSAA